MAAWTSTRRRVAGYPSDEVQHAHFAKKDKEAKSSTDDAPQSAAQSLGRSTGAMAADLAAAGAAEILVKSVGRAPAQTTDPAAGDNTSPNIPKNDKDPSLGSSTGELKQRLEKNPAAEVGKPTRPVEKNPNRPDRDAAIATAEKEASAKIASGADITQVVDAMRRVQDARKPARPTSPQREGDESQKEKDATEETAAKPGTPTEEKKDGASAAAVDASAEKPNTASARTSPKDARAANVNERKA